MKQKRECDTCARKAGESKDADGKRTVRCKANIFQMYAPYARDCEKWEQRR